MTEETTTTTPEAAAAEKIQNTVENPTTTAEEPEGGQIRRKKAFTATVVTFALTALLIFMVVWTLMTGSEDKNGVVAGAMVIATSAIQFYFGTKNGGKDA